MNILVSSAALRSGGSLTIYNQFLSHLKESVGSNRVLICVDESMPKPDIENVKYLTVDIRRNIKRIYFDWVGCKRLMRQIGFEPDVIISLQNTGLCCYSHKPQIIYYHQPIPLYDYVWNPLRSGERALFFYKRIYPWFVKKSLFEGTKVVVQAEAIKQRFCKRFNFDKDKIYVLRPDLEKIECEASAMTEDVKLIYPAAPYKYKNHKVIVNTICILRSMRPDIYSRLSVDFTLDPDAAPDLAQMVRAANLASHINMTGTSSHGSLMARYNTSTALLFPSMLESFGLPLTEAAAVGLPIITADVDYSREVLNSYTGVTFVSPCNPQSWAEAIIRVAEEGRRYEPIAVSPVSDWHRFFKLIEE